MKNYPLGTLSLENDRLYLRHTTRGSVTTIDVTPVWHFFNEVNEFKKEPLPPSHEVGMLDKDFKFVCREIEHDTAESIIADYMEALGTVQLPEEVWLWIAEKRKAYHSELDQDKI